MKHHEQATRGKDKETADAKWRTEQVDLALSEGAVTRIALSATLLGAQCTALGNALFEASTYQAVYALVQQLDQVVKNGPVGIAQRDIDELQRVMIEHLDQELSKKLEAVHEYDRTGKRCALKSDQIKKGTCGHR